MSREGCGVPISFLLVLGLAGGGVLNYLIGRIAPPVNANGNETPRPVQKAAQSLEEASASLLPEGVIIKQDGKRYSMVWDETRGMYVEAEVVEPYRNDSQNDGGGESVPENPQKLDPEIKPEQDQRAAEQIAPQGSGPVVEAIPVSPTPISETSCDQLQQPKEGSIMIPGMINFEIVLQPEGDNNWVNETDHQITLFRAPKKNGVTALIAHNTREGGKFFLTLKEGSVVHYCVDSKDTKLLVVDIHDYQALDPKNLAGDFIDLKTGERLTAGDVFSRNYGGRFPYVFQTCLTGNNGDPFWGRRFIGLVILN